ncbi:hypothetical protein BH23PLA1_BH23PLA1_14770 [soil metagenome]
MKGKGSGAVLRQIETLFREGVVAGRSDAELLDRFVKKRDESAFTAIVARHGPMVLGVCRRSLRDPGEVEDAFQATFLVLVRRSGTIRVDDSLGRWLYGVTRRVVARARRQAERRPDSRAAIERESPAPCPSEVAAGRELSGLLQAEVDRLPETYRAPVVLCHLEGRSHEEAARSLNWPVGTVKGRLSRARTLLRDRLARRGVTSAVPVPIVLVRSTVKTAMQVAAAQSAAGVVPGAAVALAEGVLMTMGWTSLKTIIAASVLAGGLLGGGVGWSALSQDRKGPDDPPETTPRNSEEARIPRELEKVPLPEYVVEPPDLIRVEVLEALPGRPITGELLVRPDGSISLNFYGEVYVAGLTPREIKEKVVVHLRQFLADEVLGLVVIDPDDVTKNKEIPPAESDRVFVDVTAYNSKVYYVQGDVVTSGRFHVTGSETVLDAITWAGGLLPSADPEGIRLVRPSPPGGEEILPIDFDAIVHKGDTATNYQIRPGDRIIVGRLELPADKADPDIVAVSARLDELERKLDRILGALQELKADRE